MLQAFLDGTEAGRGAQAVLAALRAAPCAADLQGRGVAVLLLLLRMLKVAPPRVLPRRVCDVDGNGIDDAHGRGRHAAQLARRPPAPGSRGGQGAASPGRRDSALVEMSLGMAKGPIAELVAQHDALHVLLAASTTSTSRACRSRA